MHWRRWLFNIVSLAALAFWAAMAFGWLALFATRRVDYLSVSVQVSPNPILRFVAFPLVLVTLVIVALMPFFWVLSYLKRLTRRKRACAGACPHCGYNLTGNTSGVCPECGVRVPQRAEASVK